MSLSKKIKISITVGIVVAILFSICSFAKTSEEIRSDVLRLHVIANSDTSVDQNLKLRLRDYILQEGKDIFNGSVNVENAVEKIEPVLPELEKSATAFVNRAGFDYDVKISLSNEYFTTRTYETVTLPAGKYLALRVVIGSGEGHNWWCVMFPPLCILELPGGEIDYEELKTNSLLIKLLKSIDGGKLWNTISEKLR